MGGRGGKRVHENKRDPRGMRFCQYSRATRKSQVSFILQSIGSRGTQGWASSFGDGAVEETEWGRGGRERKGEGGGREKEKGKGRGRNPSGWLAGGGTAVN